MREAFSVGFALAVCYVARVAKLAGPGGVSANVGFVAFHTL